MLETFFLSWHIVQRNWMVYKKSLISNISPTLADPAFIIISLGIGLGAMIADIEGRTYIQFLAPGMAISTAMFTAFFETSYGFFVRMTFENIFKAMLTTPIGISEIVLGEFMWVAIKGALMYSGVSIVLLGFGLMSDPKLIVLTPVVGVLVALPLGALGLLSSCYVKNINQFQTVYSFLISPLYFFSGIFFPIDQMAPQIVWLPKLLPLYHGVALSHSVFWNENHSEAWLFHAPVLIAYSAVLITWARIKLQRKMQS